MTGIGLTGTKDKGLLKIVMQRDKERIVLPVAPEEYTYTEERSVELVQVTNMGDVTFPGGQRASSQILKVRLPNSNQAFMAKGSLGAPHVYIKKLKKWMEKGSVVRLAIGNRVRDRVLIESVSIGEASGPTRDVNLTLRMRQYRAPLATEKKLKDVSKIQKVKIKKGDSMGGICAKYYGDASLKGMLLRYNKLGSYSAVKVGKTVKVPPRKAL